MHSGVCSERTSKSAQTVLRFLLKQREDDGETRRAECVFVYVVYVCVCEISTPAAPGSSVCSRRL